MMRPERVQTKPRPDGQQSWLRPSATFLRAFAFVGVLGAFMSAPACQEAATQGIDEACFVEGRCACRTNLDCAGDALCVDGQCVGYSADTTQDTADTDETPDTATDAMMDDVAIQPGEFLWPCDADLECNSGRCVAVSATERVCTRACVTSCPADWNCRGLQAGTGVGFFCVPNRERLCEPCLVDEACPGEGAACVQLESEAACGRDCSAGDSCPEGYACEDATSVAGKAVRQCLPVNGACQCRPANAGDEVPCETETDLGTCFGTRVCQPDGSLTSCSARTPAAEVCNGRDDDCNGFTDDRIETAICTNDNELGSCTGERFCLPAVGEVCTAATPAVEACDNLDNDCDGDTDEGFRDSEGRLSQLENCGVCGNSCVGAFANATARCDVPTTGEAPRCAVETCDLGFVRASDTSCIRPPALLCAPCTPGAVCGGPGDLCVTIDDGDTRTFCGRDCSPDNLYGEGCPDGYTCREADAQCVPVTGACDCSEANDQQIRPCSNQNRLGTCFGVSLCSAETGWAQCTAAIPGVEVCNGLDDDCDGIADDGLGGAACIKTNEFGGCTGQQVCDGAAGSLVCVGPDARAEVCNGLDDNCDGTRDEGFATTIRDAEGAFVGLKYGLSDDHCGGCGIACAPTSPVTESHCDGTPERPFCAVTACEPGYFVVDDRVCLPVPTNNLCLPCEADTDCQGPGDTCLMGPEGGRCGRDCGVGSIYGTDTDVCTGVAGERGCCPAAYLCDGAQCAPESGDCACSVTGSIRTCSTENASGSCTGVETCTASGPGAGWGACSARTPAAEVCNGVDDDCDGLVDGSDADVDTSGLAGYPDCDNVSAACSGRWACGGTSGWLCTARDPEVEICNGRDDDCDGVTDNGFTDANGAFTRVDNCGQCGLDCRVALSNLSQAPGAAAVECRPVGGAPTCVPLACAPGFTPFPPNAPRVCLPLAAASCRPCAADAECGIGGDQCVEVAPGEGTYCAQPCGASSSYAGCTGAIGQQGCCGAGFICSDVGGDALCQPASGSCQCTADRAGAVRGCQAVGNGGTTTCFGVETCGASAWGACDLSSNVEICDGLDNDCDGNTDEGFTTGGEYASDENCGACGRNCLLAFSAQALHATGTCDTAPGDGPTCALEGCRSTTEAAGLACRTDSDCAAGTCDIAKNICTRSCANDAACGTGNKCVVGACEKTCTTDAQCTAAFGGSASCVSGGCKTTFDWVNLDEADGNGCECADAEGRGVDLPDVLGGFAVPGARYLDTNCDGIDGDLGTAIFVRAGELGDGSYGAPFGSIQAAISALDTSTAAKASATPILVAGGLYEEAIRLVNGAVIHGGYSADFRTRDIVLFPTIIAATAADLAPGNPGTVTAIGIDAATELVGFTIVGWDATTAGSATYGLYVRDSRTELLIANGALIGGNGAGGSRASSGAPGTTGGNGANGKNSRECVDAACTAGSESQTGGAAGTNASCAAAVGCVGMEADSDEEKQVKDGAAVAGCTYSAGGDRSQYNGADAKYCKYDLNPLGNQVGGSGTDGTAGTDGGGGAGCNDTDGVITGNLWVAAVATAGTAGNRGTGGNGGSAGGWCKNLKGNNCTVPGPGLNRGDLGGSGGGGGAGGCGGSTGQPGGSGGASFAAFVARRGSSNPRIEYNVVIRGLGGRGGNGGNGGTGGLGGNGGVGGIALWPAWGAGIGGAGGRGGDGGNGGGGGGGCGGPSYGIAGPSLPTATISTRNTFALADSVQTSGQGGAGGLSAGSGGATAGSRGESRNVKAY